MQSNNQRIVLAVGAGAAVIAGVVFALMFMGKDPPKAPAEDRGGLELSVNEPPAGDARKALRCFVNGTFVGEFTLEQCAEKNGVSAQALDVGVDATGALAAAPTASLAPPPALPGPGDAAPMDSPVAEPAPAPSPVAQAPAPSGPTAACLRHAGSDWRQLSESMSLNGCVQALFAGQCVRPGDARYGRFGDLTLRLVPGRVEQSNDNRNFRTLVEQRRSCEIPQIR
jgi:hypothetical protein